MFKGQTIWTKRIFLPIHLHLHHLLTAMPVLHFPVSKNQFPVDKDNFIFVKVDIEECLEYVELPDVLLNEELDPITMMNLCFAVFNISKLTLFFIWLIWLI